MHETGSNAGEIIPEHKALELPIDQIVSSTLIDLSEMYTTCEFSKPASSMEELVTITNKSPCRQEPGERKPPIASFGLEEELDEEGNVMNKKHKLYISRRSRQQSR